MLAAGSMAGMERLYDTYASAMYGVIYRIVQNEELAEDLLQQACLKIWNRFGQFKKSGGRLAPWIIQVARNTAIDKIKSREYAAVAHNPDDENLAAVTAKSHPSIHPAAGSLHEVKHLLEPEHKEMIDLMFFKGHTQIEVALKLHIPLGAVKTRARAAILKLRKSLDKNVF